MAELANFFGRSLDYSGGIFVDWITMTQEHHIDVQQLLESGEFVLDNYESGDFKLFPVVCGKRCISYRDSGDIGPLGKVEQTEVDHESFTALGFEGSHDTRVSLKSDGRRVSISGNVGRLNRPDNVFNLSFNDTIAKCNRIATQFGMFPFSPGRMVGLASSDASRIRRGRSLHWTGAKLSSLHLTKNYYCGSPSNAQAVIEWLDTQSVKRIKRGRLGLTTVVFGDPKYIQVEFYLKGPELLAHSKTAHLPIAQWCYDKGMLRAEVKVALDALRDFNLRYLGEVTMDKIVNLFNDRTEILNRCKPDIEELDYDFEGLPMPLRPVFKLWLKGEDLRAMYKPRTFTHYASQLRQFGIDIAVKRNIETFPVRIRTIDIMPAMVPDWYVLDDCKEVA